MVLTDNFFEVLKYEGAVSIISWGNDEPHVTCTWNSYLVVTDDGRLLVPAAGMTSTEADIAVNNRVKVTLAAREVEGYNGYQGTGFRVEGTARFFNSGAEYDMMFAKYPFIRSVLEITPETAKQLL